MNKLILLIVTIALCYISTTDGQRYVNDLCKAGDNRWVCKRMSDCPSVQKGLRRGIRPKTCSFIGFEPVVCCGPDQQEAVKKTVVVQTLSNLPQTSSVSNISSKSKRKCIEYAEFVYRKQSLSIFGNSEPQKFADCAISHKTLIVGGVDAIAKEFPHMAQIGYGESGSISWLCGGSLISERFVLSAAHCTKRGDSDEAKWARIGDLNTRIDTDDARPVIMAIVERINHPGYKGEQLYNDIALYKLERDVQLSPYVRPICLDVEEKQTETALASGWGHTEWGGHESDTLKKVLLNRVSTESCNSTYASNIGKQLPRGILSTSQICAGDQSGKDTCQGDSGGPLQITTTEPYCMYIQIGVTSFGRACGYNNPGVYTKVSYFVPWIESIVWP